MGDANEVEDQGIEIPPTDDEASKLRLEEERVAPLATLASSRPDTVVEKVAWVLNNYPEARNSDITLQLRYWATFCHDQYDGGAITSEDLYRLPRLTSLARARARVQNTLRL